MIFSDKFIFILQIMNIKVSLSKSSQWCRDHVLQVMTVFVLCLTLSYFCSCVFSPFNIALTSLGEERATLSDFRTFVQFALVWFCLFPLPLGVWEGLRFVIVALPGLFSYFFQNSQTITFPRNTAYIHRCDSNCPLLLWLHFYLFFLAKP